MMIDKDSAAIHRLVREWHDAGEQEYPPGSYGAERDRVVREYLAGLGTVYRVTMKTRGGRLLWRILRGLNWRPWR